MVSKGRVAISIVLVIVSLIAVGTSFIILNHSYQNMNRATEKAKIACIDLRDSLVNTLRALQRAWQYPQLRSQAYVDRYNRGVDDFNNGNCLSYGLTRMPYFSANG
jgi:hypothetical protein